MKPSVNKPCANLSDEELMSKCLENIGRNQKQYNKIMYNKMDNIKYLDDYKAKTLPYIGFSYWEYVKHVVLGRVKLI